VEIIKVSLLIASLTAGPTSLHSLLNLQPQKPKVTAKQSEQYKYVLMGLKDGRGRLQSGEFRAVGVYQDVSGSQGDISANAEFYCAFDQRRSKVRFDASVPKIVATPSKDGIESKKTVAQKRVLFRKTKVILAPKESLTYEEGTRRLLIQSRNQDSDRTIQGVPFDVRALGLYDWLGFVRGYSFDTVYSHLLAWEPESIERDPSGLWSIRWEFNGRGQGEQRIWIDESKGFTVTRNEIRYGKVSSRSRTPDMVSQVTWEMVGDTWIPKTLSIHRNRHPRLLAYDLDFNWNLVNEPVRDDVFTRNGMAIAERTRVVDMTSGHEVLEEVLNDTPDHSTYFRTEPVRRPAFYWILGLNVIVLTIILLVYLTRTRKATKS
jgi:hypothetical protein